MGVSASIASSFGVNTYGIGLLSPFLGSKREGIQTCLLSNPIESMGLN